MAESPTFRLEVTPVPEDIDTLEHVSNITYVRWVQQVAEAHSTAVGWDQTAYRALGRVFVVRRHEIDYKRPALAGDLVILETWVESWRAASSIRKTIIKRASDDAELARASTEWVLVSFDTGRPGRITDQLRSDFAGEVASPATDLSV